MRINLEFPLNMAAVSDAPLRLRNCGPVWLNVYSPPLHTYKTFIRDVTGEWYITANETVMADLDARVDPRVYAKPAVITNHCSKLCKPSVDTLLSASGGNFCLV